MRARGVLVLAWLTCVCWASAPDTAGLRAGPPRCPPAAPGRCVSRGVGVREYDYQVDGARLTIIYSDGGYYQLDCYGNLTLDNPALPRFETRLRVKEAVLKRCPPRDTSYAAALAALNVLMLDKLTLIGPAHIGRAQLAGLEQLPALMVERAELEPDALAALPALLRLHLNSMRVPPATLDALPPALVTLELVRTGAVLSAAQLRRLSNLTEIIMRDPDGVAVVPAGGALRKIALDSTTSAHVPVRLLPTLCQLILIGWDERAPQPWQDCGALEELLSEYAAAEALPDDWLRACPLLRVLRLRKARALARVGEHLLRGAVKLAELRLTGSRLTALPAGLLDHALELRTVDLSDNLLHVLPSGPFAKNKALVWLDLSTNNFSRELFASLETVTSLKTLKLNNNIHLTNSCGGVSDAIRGSSSLRHMKNLTTLLLRNTSAEVICRDWRDDMLQLQELDLSANKITIIKYSDLQFRGAADVDLRGSNVTRLVYTEQDYEEVVRGGSLTRAKFHVNFTLTCDCDAYWAAVALRARPEHVQLGHVQCAGGGELAASPEDELTCAAPHLCAPGCACGTRDIAAPPQPAPPQPAPPQPAPPQPEHPPRALHVRCSGVTRMPRLPPGAAGYALTLQLAQNNISHISIDDLPPHLLELDLQGNQISRLDEDVARALTAGSRRLRLAGNPLACDCSAAPALRVLHLAGALPTACQPACPPPAAVLAGAALAALLAAGVLLALLARPALRRRLKRALRAAACGGGAPPADCDDGRRFDVFVSFSHGDERFVREQLVARLESGPAPYRLCVHYRDWAPGGWIPAQIAASVRASRRTLAVVSEHFLRSAWARAELREAHALALQEREPRLVLLLLDEPARLPLDERLRRYLARNTYVRWGDPFFWHKLQLALPRACAAPLAPPAPPPSSPLAAPAPPPSSPPSPPPADVGPLAATDHEPQNTLT